MDMIENTTMNMPVLALRGLTIFPGCVISFDVERDISIRALERAMEQVVHDLRQQVLHHRPKAPGADVALDGLVGHRLQGPLGKGELHLVVGEQLLVLLHQGVLGLRQDAHQVLPLQGVQGRDARSTRSPGRARTPPSPGTCPARACSRPC